MSKYKIKNIQPSAEEHSESYGFFVVTETAKPDVELAAFCYHTPGVSSPLACESYPTEATAQCFATVFAGVISLWPDTDSDTAPVNMVAVVRSKKAVAA